LHWACRGQWHILRDADDLALQEAVAREIEGVDLYLGLLAGADEADVAIGDHRFGLQMAVRWHDGHQLLRGRDDAADRKNKKLGLEVLDTLFNKRN
jgi:hypothetical protein